MDFTRLVIKEHRTETDEYSSILFIKPKNFSFILGECFSFRFPGESSSKVFSFASSPTEDTIIISYKKGISPFKKRLQDLRVNDTIEISQYGSQFHFNEHNGAVFVAGGIGITAFRSIIKYCVDEKITIPLHLIFVNKSEQFPFQRELLAFKKDMTNLTLSFISTNIKGRLTKNILLNIISEKSNDFYIAGPPFMVDDTVLLLKKIGIKENFIHTESFDGYTEEV